MTQKSFKRNWRNEKLTGIHYMNENHIQKTEQVIFAKCATHRE